MPKLSKVFIHTLRKPFLKNLPLLSIRTKPEHSPNKTNNIQFYLLVAFYGLVRQFLGPLC